MTEWINKAVFYHIYPLGLCDAPFHNNLSIPVTYRIEQLKPWIKHLSNLGVNAIYLGPFFESVAHGYDTIDYYHIDRRLGDRKSFFNVVKEFNENGIKVVFDAVFNHVGRDFWAFKDVRHNKQHSKYCDWFDSLEFGKKSPYGDPFTYKGWQNHYNLVKLNLKNPAVKEHLFKAVEMWVKELGCEGLRLDAADCLDLEFLKELRVFCKNLNPNFWLLGEIIHGDYNIWANKDTLDSVTNYECYKGLYSSFNDKNMFEIAHSLNRQFGKNGVYKDLQLYSFVDNHDVNRISSTLKNEAHLYPLHGLLFTISGIPSIYYGSEFAIKGTKKHNSDHPLRPALNLEKIKKDNPQPSLLKEIQRFIKIRSESEALQIGSYSQLHVSSEQFAFLRKTENESVIVIVNASEKVSAIEFEIPEIVEGILIDVLNNNETFEINKNKLKIETLWPTWLRILKLEKPPKL